jgi:hypothetical protein
MNADNDALTERMTAAMHRSVRLARVMHNALGVPIAVWLDGRVQLLDAETLQPVARPEDVGTARDPGAEPSPGAPPHDDE